MTFGYLHVDGQYLGDADDDVGFVAQGSKFALESAEVAFYYFYFHAGFELAVVEGYLSGRGVHDEDEVLHLTVGDDEGAVWDVVAYVKKGDGMVVGDGHGGLEGGAKEYEVSD